MTADIVMKQGDLEPPISISLTDDSGTAIDVSTAQSIKFRMAPVLTRAEIFLRDATVDDAVGGLLSYTWRTGDTDTAGTYYGEFVITWPTARPQTFPTAGYMTIAIEPKL